MRWSDSSGLFSKYEESLRAHHMKELCKVSVSQIYPHQQEFFINSAAIDREPTVSERLKLLQHLANTNAAPKVLPDVIEVGVG